jgi:cytochrome c peroxidase
MFKKILIPFLIATIAIVGCIKDPDHGIHNDGHTHVNLDVPPGLPEMEIPTDNPLTAEGIALGRKLFFDPILSVDSTQSCGSCHNPKDYFVDDEERFSVGVDGIAGTRNSMPLFNIGYSKTLFWDGGAPSLEDQAIDPIVNPIEMHNTWQKAVADLNAHPDYPALFQAAFPTSDSVETKYVVRAIAQFERTLLSANSKFDQEQAGTYTFTDAEARGMDVFIAESKGDCFHCHSFGGTFTDFEMRNNGLDLVYADSGRYNITGNRNDIGKFKTPTLRNIEFTAPYMHDGRFKTLLECINHYNVGVKEHPNASPLLTTLPKGRMSAQDVSDLIAFLKTLSDYEFVNNPDFQDPNP